MLANPNAPKAKLGDFKFEFGRNAGGTIILRLNKKNAPGEWFELTTDEAEALGFNLMLLAAESKEMAPNRGAVAGVAR